jgi:DNA-binding XRE family transcriptional regulator
LDKRRKPIPREIVLADRIQFYRDIEAGKLSLQDAVKKMRAITGLTQPEFAKHRGVSLRVIRELEKGGGNPTVGTINQIAGIFSLEVALRRKPTEESPDR